jgi:hypothetical protein
MVVKIIEDAYSTISQTNGKEYWNAKVELPDGSHKLASVGGITGDLFTKAWGDETGNWTGHFAEVDIRESKVTGNKYIVLVPSKKEPVELGDEDERISPDQIPF